MDSAVSPLLRRSAVLALGLLAASATFVHEAAAQNQRRPSWCQASRGDVWTRDKQGNWYCVNREMDERCEAAYDELAFWNVREQQCEECFITTACCSLIGLSDDCWELQILRRFRDEYLLPTAEGRAAVELYYDTAPRVLAAIGRSPTARRELSALYALWILPAALLIRFGLNRAAQKHYTRMMRTLIARHLAA